MTAATTPAPFRGTRARPDAAREVRADIEGLRGVAVGTVVLYHVGVPFMPGGFAGVDIFFVISGFLITSLLLREAARDGRISITRFYARRARRLLPAATTVLVVTAVAGWAVLPSSRYADLSTDVVAATLYVVNWALAGRAVDYLAEGSGVSPLQHFWSLSVEEQYYLAWPLLMILGLLAARNSRARARRLMFGAVAVVFVVSLAWSVAHTRSDPAASYFVSTTRVWELAVGSLLAFGTGRLAGWGTRAAQLLGGIGLVLIAASVTLLDGSTPWPGWAALVPTLGAAAVIAAGCSRGGSTPSGVLGIRPLIWVGGISYSLYLWHWPLIVLADERWPNHGMAGSVAVVAVAVLLAWLTKRMIEDPVRFHPRLAAPHVSHWPPVRRQCQSRSWLGSRSRKPPRRSTPAASSRAPPRWSGTPAAHTGVWSTTLRATTTAADRSSRTPPLRPRTAPPTTQGAARWAGASRCPAPIASTRIGAPAPPR